jgi:hypothetical protein
MCPIKQQAYCKIYQQFVDIKQGFESCIIEHQCFSDDLCPLDKEFQAATKTTVAAQIKPMNISRITGKTSPSNRVD